MIYKVICKECGYESEIELPMTADKVPNCPDCKGERRKLIEIPIPVIYKDTGFTKRAKE